MRTRYKNVALVAIVFLSAVSGIAGAVEFKFTIPIIPSAPKIVSVTNGQAVSGGNSIPVYANIQGQTQKEVCCNGVCTHQCEPNCDFSACGMMDFYGAADPRVTPNPTCIPGSTDTSGGAAATTCGGKSGNPKLFYYYNADPSTTSSVNMTYDSITGNFKGNIPIEMYSGGDVVTYYIAAADNRGNVVSEIPDPMTAPCSAATSWDGGYDTPPLANCSMMNSYEECALFKSGTPACGSDYTVNDPVGDTCGEAGTLSANSRVDIVGMTLGYGKGFSELPTDNVVCAKVKMATNPPDIGDGATPIDAYMMIFFNPDIADPNPNDVYMPNATAISYTPGVNGADPNLVKVLWNGECVTNPNTSDPLSCKLITGGSNESKLKISSAGGFLTFIAKDAIPGGKTIVGQSTKSVNALIGTGEIQLDGGTPFWLTDMTSGVSMIAKNHYLTICNDCVVPPAPPIVPPVATCINGDGTAFASGVCSPSASPTAGNKCRLTINPSLDPADKYTIYRTTTGNASAAIKIADITTNLAGQNIYDDTITALNGYTNRYFFSASKFGLETPQKDWSFSDCVPEDVLPGAVPTIAGCDTPPGTEGVCECRWNIDTNSDPTLIGFRMLRDAAIVADESKLKTAAGVNDYSYTDPGVLSAGNQYLYTIKSVDAGANVSSGATATCTAEDLKAPAKIDSISLSLIQAAEVGVKVTWNGGPEADIGGYNVYKCNNANYGCGAFPSNNWLQMNNEPVSHTGTGMHSITDPDVRDGGTAESDWCFWVEACDTCAASGHCPSTNVPNCSAFTPIKPYRGCVHVYVGGIGPPPSTPGNVAAVPPAVGESCLLTWSPVTTSADGTPFKDPNNPNPFELSTYYVMRAPLGETVPNNPNTASPGNIAGTANVSSSPTFLDTGLTNGATYQYLVIAYDVQGNYSSPQISPATCSPTDTTDPAEVSTVSATIGESQASCDISWQAVADKNALTYSVHRCDKTAASCAKATSVDFPNAWGAELGMPITGITPPLELSDTTVDLATTSAYTYCITARDPSGNETPIFTGANAGAASNCAQCSVEAPPPTVEPPAGVVAEPYSTNGNTGVKIRYNNSPSYAENGNTGGHTIYICSTSSPASCSKTIASGLTSNYSSVSKDFPDLISYSVSPGTYYFAVSYKNDLGTESTKTMSGAVSIVIVDPTTPCDVAVPPASCNTKIKVGKITEKKIIACAKAADPTGCKSDAYKIVEAAPAGAVVRIIDANTGETVKTAYPAANGTVAEISIDPVNTPWYIAGRQYRVVVDIPADSYSGLYGACANSSTVAADGKCSILLKGQTSFSSSSPLTTEPRTIPKARALAGDAPGSVFVGYGGDIGDVGGDGKVNISDMMDIKSAYGKTKASGSQCYKPWADANLDGAVTIADMMIIRSYYNKTNVVPKANGETITPTLRKTADPMPACCKTSPPTCQ